MILRSSFELNFLRRACEDMFSLEQITDMHVTLTLYWDRGFDERLSLRLSCLFPSQWILDSQCEEEEVNRVQLEVIQY